MALLPTIASVFSGDWNSVVTFNRDTQRAIQKLSSFIFGPTGSPTFAGLTITGLIPNRLVYSDANRSLTSVANLTSWVAGTANEITVADDGDGTITIGLVDPLIVGKGGTGASTLANHALLLGTDTSAIRALGVATNGQIPIGSTGADPTLATLSEGEGIDITNAAGSITILGEDASTTNKGIASFSSTWFSVTAGAVSFLPNPTLSSLIIDAAASAATLTERRCDGTLVSPTKVLANELVGQVVFSAFGSNDGYALEQYYDVNDDTYLPVVTATWEGQTFTTVGAFAISKVALKLYRLGSPGTLTVSIRATAANLPTGGDLDSVTGTLNANTITTDANGEWYDIILSSPISLSATTKYAIIARLAGGDGSNQVRWRVDNTSPTYAGGNGVQSTNSGSSWASVSTADAMFRTYSGSGTPTGSYRSIDVIGGYAEVDQTDVSGASYLRFDTTASGSVTPREVMRLTSTGILQLPVSLTASRLAATDANKGLASVADLTAWVAGTTNRVTVANDGDGTITLSGPQDLHTAASPTFEKPNLVGAVITNGSGKDGKALYIGYGGNNFPMTVGVTRANGFAWWGFNAEQSTVDNQTFVVGSGSSPAYRLAPIGANSDLTWSAAANGTAGGTITWTTTLVMTNAGKVGIGKVPVSEVFEVNGKCRADTAFNLNGTDGLSQTTGNPGTITSSGGIITVMSANPYGSMYCENTTTAIVIATVDTYVEVTTGMSGGTSSGMTFQNNHEIKALTAGKYLATWSMSVSSDTASREVEGTIMINGTTVTGLSSHGETSLGAAGRPMVISASGIITLAINDVVSLAIENHTDAVDLVLQHATCTLVKVGS